MESCIRARDLASLAGEGARCSPQLRPTSCNSFRLNFSLWRNRYDVVVANPPYMGSNNMNKWLAV